MIRVQPRNGVIDTYYNKSFEDEAQVFVEESLTDQSFFWENDIYSLLASGNVATRPLNYGEQNFMQLDELQNIKREFVVAFNKLPREEKMQYGGLDNYIKTITNPNNYSEVVLDENKIVSEEVIENEEA